MSNSEGNEAPGPAALGTAPGAVAPGSAAPKRPAWYTPSPKLEAFRAAVLAFVNTPEEDRDPAHRGQDLKELRHLLDQGELTFAEWAGAFAATEEAERQGSASTVDWVRHEAHMSGTAAAKAIRVGEQMATLPESVAAVRTGEIGFAHLELMASTAAAVTESKDAPPFDEQPLLAKAREHSVGRFAHDCTNARHAADAAGFLAEHLTAVEWRSFEMNECPGGVLLRGRLDTVGADMLRSALEPLATKNGAEDTRRRKRRMADALIELANHGLDSGELPSQAGQRPHVQVTTTLETLMGVCGAPAGQMQFSGPVSVATVQRLACDSSITRILVRPKSAILDIGRAKRVPSTPQRRALVARDGGCVWPGCERPAAWTAAHHFKHWGHFGVTELPNMGLVCYRHHEMCHEGGWTLAWADDGRLLTIPPSPDWPVPRGVRAPTDAEEEAARASEESGVDTVRAVLNLRPTVQPPPDVVPF